jgi:PAS domain S-box-containing protein
MGRTISACSEGLDFQDMESLIQAIKAIAKEVSPKSIVSVLIQAVLKSTAAQKVLFLALETDGWQVSAIGDRQCDAVRADLSILWHQAYQHIPSTVIDTVIHTQNPLVLENPGNASEWAADPYIASQQPKSICVIPIGNDHELLGILYLENQFTAKAFTDKHLHLLKHLCSQAVTSLANARLYQGLEQRLQQRTAALQESEQSYRLLSELSPVGIYRSNLQGECTYANSKTLQLTGMSAAEILGNRWANNIHPDDCASVFAKWQSFVQRAIQDPATEYSNEIRCVHPDGKIVWLYTQAVSELNADREITGFVGTVVDITERKQAEAALQASERRYAKLVEMLPTGVFRTDPQGNCIYVNSCWCELSGLTTEEAAGRGWEKALHPGDRDRVFQGWYQAAQNREMPYVTNCRYQRPDGKVSWVVVHAIEEVDYQGNVTGYVGNCIDITERKNAELTLQQLNQELELRIQERTQELVRSEQDLRTIFNNVYDAIYIHDLDGKILDVNDRTLELHGASREEIFARGVPGLSAAGAPVEKLQEIFARVNAGEKLQFEWQGRRLDDNSTFDAEVSLQRATLGDRPVVIAGVRDIGDRKAAEKALQDSEKRYRVISTLSPVGIWKSDPNGANVYANEKAAQLVGVELEQLKGEGWAQNIAAGERDRVFAEWQDFLTKLQTQPDAEFQSEIPFVHADNTQVWTLVKAVAELDVDGKIIGTIGTGTDISDRKAAENALRESEERYRLLSEQLRKSEQKYRTLFEGNKDAVFIFGKDGGALDCNPATLEMFGFEQKEDFLGLKPWLLSPKYQPDGKTADEAAEEGFAILQQQGWRRSEWLHQRTDGSLFYAEVWVVLLELEGEPIIQAVVRDISDRKAAEAALRQSEATQRAILSAIPDLLVRIDANGTYLDVMSGGNVTLIHSVEKIINHSVYEVLPYHLAQQRSDLIKQALATGETLIYEYEIETQGELHYEEARIVVCGEDEVLVIVRDISDRKMTEQALRESEERYRSLAIELQQSERKFRTLFEGNKDSLTIYSQQGIVECNPATLEMFGYESEEQFSGMQPWQFSPEFQPDGRESYEKALEKIQVAIAQGENRFEWLHMRRDGTEFYAEVLLIPIEINNEQLLLGIVRNIDDRKKAEAERLQAEQIRKELNLLEKILEVTMAGYWDWDIANNQQYLSPGFKKMFGYEDHELVNAPKTWQNLIFAEDLPRVFDIFERHAQSRGEIPYYSEVRYRHRDGSAVWVICVGQVIEWDDQGNPMRMIGCHINITDRKVLEEELMESRAFLQSIYDGTEVAISVLEVMEDGNYQYVDANPATTELAGVEPDFLRGKTINDLQPFIPPEDFALLLGTYQQCVTTGKPVQFENATIVNGQETWWLTKVNPLLNAQGVVYRLIISAIPITDRKRAELALQQSEENFRQLTENIREVFYVISPEFDQLIYISPGFEDIWGRSPEPFYEDFSQWVSIVHPDDIDRIIKQLSIPEERFNFADDYRIIRPDGEVRWVFSRCFPVKNESGEVVKIVGVAEDITARKQVELALRESEQRYATLAETSPVGIFRNDETGSMVYANSRWSEITGITFAEATGNGWLKCVHPDWRDRLVNEWEYIIQEGTHHYTETRLQMPDGSTKWVYCLAQPEKDAAGNVVGCVGTLTDITDLKQVESVLLEAQRVAHIGNWEFDPYTEKIHWSEELFRIFGLDPAQGEPDFASLEQLFQPEYRIPHHQVMSRALSDGIAYQLDLGIIRADGSLGYINARGEVEIDSQGQIIRLFGTAIDITDRKQAEEQIRSTQERMLAQEKLASLGTLTAGVAHELRNPLNFVKNYAEGSIELTEDLADTLAPMLQTLASETSTFVEDLLSDLSENARTIHYHSQRVAQIIDSMMEHARTDSEHAAPQATNLHDLLDRAIKLAYHGKRAQETGFNLSISTDFATDLEPIQTIQSSLMRAFINLIDNACDAMRLKQIQLQADSAPSASDYTPTLAIATHSLGDQVEIRIRDNGCGIDAEIQSRILDPFFTTKPPGEGTGLGLSLTHDIIVKQHQGAIAISSEPGKFTEIVVTLPYS